MRLCSLVPVQEALDIDGVADVEVLYCLINIGILAAQVGLYGKGIGCSVCRYIEVNIVTFGSGAIVVVQEGCVLTVCILACLYLKARSSLPRLSVTSRGSAT